MVLKLKRMPSHTLPDRVASSSSVRANEDTEGGSDGNKESGDVTSVKQARNSTQDRLRALTLNDPKVQASLAKGTVEKQVTTGKKDAPKKKASVSANALKSAMFG